MSYRKSIPVNGALVKLHDGEALGVVIGSREGVDSNVDIHLRWPKINREEWVDLRQVRAGFKIGMEVQDIPRSRTRKPLGEGVVVETRRIGGRDQVLVDFYRTGQKVWLPYENMRQIKGVQHRFFLAETGEAGTAERFRLRSLAYAVEMWNQNTGSLSRLDIDPLPHQIHLVHHILASGNLNWLIADDVGLGKTIEVGMLLSALKQRGTFRRILLVTPAGLVRQWQEELHYKFGMSDFQIYDTDFHINDARQWKMYDHVIGSIDRFKSESHLQKLLEAGAWDLIVFDEAHRLSRRQWGMKYEASERYKLAQELRSITDAMLLLSATPHQGMHDKFQGLLNLLRPELHDEILALDLHPEFLREMVIRNHKADVTDADGNFVFQGKITKAIRVNLGEEEEAFDKALQHYLRIGYAAGEKKGRQGKAIGFVMSIYRKLAASSIAAIEKALTRRLALLRDEHARNPGNASEDDDQRIDDRFIGEQEEIFWQTDDKEFFSGEINMLVGLIAKAKTVLVVDNKLHAFLDELVGQVQANNQNEKLLIFTEYRATQEYLAQALASRFGEDSISLIHGGLTYEEREQGIVHFEEHGRFLISTEAGGEGINLHRRCHVMVNYDLPWNPMRLVQRVGRLYRYGQKKKVVVFNMHAPQAFDATIMGLMYERISQVVSDMAGVSSEFTAGLEDEILGELADMLDVGQILEEAMTTGIDRTKERIDEALLRARDAVEKQRDLFQHASSFDPDEARKELRISVNHVRGFIEGMLLQTGIAMDDALHGGAIMDLHIPEAVRKESPGLRARMRITLDRDLAARRPDLHMMDFDSPLLNYLLEKAKSYAFGGTCASLQGLDARAVVTAMLQWQNDQGMHMREEYTALVIDADGRVEVNPERFGEWLLVPANDGTAVGNRDEAKALWVRAEVAFDKRLGEVSNLDLHPEGRLPVNAGWFGEAADPLM